MHIKLDAPVLKSASPINEDPKKLALIWENVELPCNYMEIDLFAKDPQDEKPDFKLIGRAETTDTDAVVQSGDSEVAFIAGHTYEIGIVAYGGKGIAEGADSDMSNTIKVTFS